MDNYQPKYSDPAITLPFIADKHRKLGNKFYDFYNGQKLNVEVGNEPLYNFWKNEANKMANAKVESTISSQNRMLKPRHPRLIPYNRSGQPFFSNIDQSNKNMSVSGSGNTTYSARLSDADRDNRRKKILERLGDNYVKFKAGDTSEDVRQPPIISPEDAIFNQGELLLDQIMERLNNNDYKYTLLEDIYKFQKFLVENIYKWNDYGKFKSYIDKLTTLMEQLEASASVDIAIELRNRRENYVEKLLDAKIRERDGRQDPSEDYKLKSSFEAYERLADDYVNGMSRFIETSINVLYRILEYIKGNVQGIGQSERARKQIAKALTSEFKLTNTEIENFRKRNQEYFKKLQKEETRFFEDLNIPIPPEIADDWSTTGSTRSTESQNINLEGELPPAGEFSFPALQPIEGQPQPQRPHSVFGALPYMADETQWIKENISTFSDDQLMKAFQYYKYLRDEALGKGDMAKAKQEQSRIDALMPDGGRLEQLLFNEANIPPSPQEIRPTGLGRRRRKLKGGAMTKEEAQQYLNLLHQENNRMKGKSKQDFINVLVNVYGENPNSLKNKQKYELEDLYLTRKYPSINRAEMYEALGKSTIKRV